LISNRQTQVIISPPACSIYKTPPNQFLLERRNQPNLLIRPTLKSELSIKSCCAELGSNASPQPSPSRASSSIPDTTATAGVIQGGVAVLTQRSNCPAAAAIELRAVSVLYYGSCTCMQNVFLATKPQPNSILVNDAPPAHRTNSMFKGSKIKISMGWLFPLFH